MNATNLSITPVATDQPMSAPLELHPPQPGQPGLIKEEPGTLIWRETVPGQPSAIVKMYRNRGPDLGLRGGRLPYRVQREYNTLVRLARAGLLCTPPLFWARGKDALQGRFEILATAELPAVTPLRELAASDPDAVRQLDLRGLFAAARTMHRAGVRHGAFSPKNILVGGRGATSRFYLVDLSRAVLFPGDLAGTRMAWFDLADLTVKLLAVVGADTCSDLLLHYGLAPRDAEALLADMPRYKATRHTRNRLRFEFALRSLWAEIFRH